MKYYWAVLLLLLAIGGLRTRNMFENLQSMKRYLAVLLWLIIVAGMLCAFAIIGSMDEGPSRGTYFCIYLIPWYVLMMLADILLLSYLNLKYGNLFIGLLSIGVIGPAIIYLIIISG